MKKIYILPFFLYFGVSSIALGSYQKPVEDEEGIDKKNKFIIRADKVSDPVVIQKSKITGVEDKYSAPNQLKQNYSYQQHYGYEPPSNKKQMELKKVDKKIEKQSSNFTQNFGNQSNPLLSNEFLNHQSYNNRVYVPPRQDSSFFEWGSLDKEKIKEQENKIIFLTQNISQLEDSNWQFKNELEKIHKEKRFLEVQKLSLESEFQEKCKNHKELSLLYDQSLDSYNRDKKLWEKERIRLEDNLLESNRQNEKLIHEKKNLEHHTSQLKEKLNFSDSTLKEREYCIDELKNTLLSKEEELIKVVHQRDNLESEIRLLNQHSIRLQQDLDNTKKLISVGQKSLNTYLKKEEESRDFQIQRYFRELEELKEKNLIFEKENDLLRFQKQELENKVKEIVEEKNNSSSLNHDALMVQSTIDELKEKNQGFEKLLIKQKSDYEEEIMNLKQFQMLNQMNSLQMNPNGESKKLDAKLRSFIPEFFTKLFIKAGIKEEKIDDYVMELMDEKLGLLDLLQKAESFTKKENI